MDKFKNKYRVQSARLQNWDYGWNAAYFVTICTANRKYFFGEIVDRKMKLSEIGKLADEFLLEIPRRYEYANLDEFVVMPNHVHAIVVIEKIGDGRKNVMDYDDVVKVHENDGRDAIHRVSGDAMNRVPTNQTPEKRGGITGNKNPMLHQNISRILNWYKGRVTFASRKIHAGFAWQPRFHDHIIRDDASHQRIKNYIINNPKNWRDDSFHNK